MNAPQFLKVRSSDKSDVIINVALIVGVVEARDALPRHAKIYLNCGQAGLPFHLSALDTVAEIHAALAALGARRKSCVTV